MKYKITMEYTGGNPQWLEAARGLNRKVQIGDLLIIGEFEAETKEEVSQSLAKLPSWRKPDGFNVSKSDDSTPTPDYKFSERARR